MSDSQPIKDIRDQLKAEQKARADAEAELAELRTFRQQAVFREAGFDPESGPGRALAKLHDGEFTVDALRETASTYGLAGEAGDGDAGAMSDAASRVHDAGRVMADATRDAAPAQGKKIAYDDLKSLAKTDFAAAAAALKNGVDGAPPQIERAMSARHTNPIK